MGSVMVGRTVASLLLMVELITFESVLERVRGLVRGACLHFEMTVSVSSSPFGRKVMIAWLKP